MAKTLKSRKIRRTRKVKKGRKHRKHATRRRMRKSGGGNLQVIKYEPNTDNNTCNVDIQSVNKTGKIANYKGVRLIGIHADKCSYDKFGKFNTVIQSNTLSKSLRSQYKNIQENIGIHQEETITTQPEEQIPESTQEQNP